MFFDQYIDFKQFLKLARRSLQVFQGLKIPAKDSAELPEHYCWHWRRIIDSLWG